jgi:hypothetical protein
MFLCEKCEQEFPQTPQGKKDWLLHRASNDAPQGKVPMSATAIKIEKAEEKKKQEKPRLEYVWRGVCDTCGSYLETIEVDVGQPKGKTTVVAFCVTCKKQVAYRPVEKL